MDHKRVIIRSPKFQRNLQRIVPFAIIWLITGWVFLFVETVATRNRNIYPDESVTVTGPVLVFASIMLVLVGLLVGVIELVALEKQFQSYSFGRKILYKFGIYLVFMFVLVQVTFVFATAIELGTYPFDWEVLSKLARFDGSIVFVNTAIQLAFQLLLSLLYAAISENLGHNVLKNFFTGRYHRPKQEERVFMFLDMKDSTTIAEKLGHVQYFDLLQAYYEAMSDSIINTYGDVYQYIGDEVVVTWKKEAGLRDNNCICCYNGIKANLRRLAGDFEKRFGVAPDFKAGIHLGEVTTGEVGALKKEIVYTGDVLNTTARIQAKCKEFGFDLIVSRELQNGLEDSSALTFRPLGEMELKGKEKKVELLGLE